MLKKVNMKQDLIVMKIGSRYYLTMRNVINANKDLISDRHAFELIKTMGLMLYIKED